MRQPRAAIESGQREVLELSRARNQVTVRVQPWLRRRARQSFSLVAFLVVCLALSLPPTSTAVAQGAQGRELAFNNLAFNNTAQQTATQGPASQDASPQTNSTVEVRGFLDIVLSGGWVGVTIVLVLVVLSIIAVYLIVEQILVLRKREVMPEGLADQVRQLLSQGRLPDADALCRKSPSPLSFVLISGLSEIDFGWHSMEKAMEDAVAEQAAKLYRKIEYLSVIGNLAPMCGLLGTVTGMIFAFQQVAVTQGMAGAGDLAEGIYSALVTTVAGLVVAIPSLGAFAIFRNRIDQLIAETAYVSQHVFGPVRRRATQVASRAATPPSPPRTGG